MIVNDSRLNKNFTRNFSRKHDFLFVNRRGSANTKPNTNLINKADKTISFPFTARHSAQINFHDRFKISLKFDVDVIESALCVKMIKYLVLIIVVSLLIAPSSGLLSSKTSTSNEVNETIVNYKALNTRTTAALNEEKALEQRLADVL
jgi:hypothetical protein